MSNYQLTREGNNLLNTENFRTFFEVYSTTDGRIFFSEDGRNHEKMYIFLMAKTTINIQTVENVMKKRKTVIY